jgi:hypothetical protein
LIVLERDGVKESGQLSNAPVQVVGFCHSTQPHSNLVKIRMEMPNDLETREFLSRFARTRTRVLGSARPYYVSASGQDLQHAVGGSQIREFNER